MAPKGQEQTWALYEADDKTQEDATFILPPSAEKREWKIVWRNVFWFAILHISSIYGLYLFLFEAMWRTGMFAYFLYICSGLGITAGVHRLWAHKAYKARLPLQIVLMIFNTLAWQDDVIDWSRDHRLHHKYSETDADPHNATRGFFFSHVGWLMVRKHPKIKEIGSTIDVSDLRADPVLQFQKKYYKIIMPLICFILPAVIPMLWGETLWNGFFVCSIFRYVYVLNVTWLVNSAAHIWGPKPYNKNIKPVETLPVTVLVLGEGFHNYHHTFPWDYKSAELPGYTWNFSKLFIDAMALIGQAYDMKTVSPELVEARVKRTGDGSHRVWGWDDKDVTAQDKEGATIVNPSKSE